MALIVHEHVCLSCLKETDVNESDAMACNWNIVTFCDDCIKHRWKRFRGTMRHWLYMLGIKRYPW